MISTAMVDILQERKRQDEKWGEQNHNPFLYLTVLGEEFGDTCQAALDAKFKEGSLAALRYEAIQTAAVAMAIVECLDRQKWRWSIPASETVTASKPAEKMKVVGEPIECVRHGSETESMSSGPDPDGTVYLIRTGTIYWWETEDGRRHEERFPFGHPGPVFKLVRGGRKADPEKPPALTPAQFFFFRAFDDARNIKPHLVCEVGYSRVTDWMVTVWDASGCSIENARKLLSRQSTKLHVALNAATEALLDLTAKWEAEKRR